MKNKDKQIIAKLKDLVICYKNVLNGHSAYSSDITRIESELSALESEPDKAEELSSSRHQENDEPDIDDFITQEKVNEWIDTVERRTEEIISSNPYSIHPSRLEGYQFREAIRFLAKQIDTLHNLRIQSWKTKTNA